MGNKLDLACKTPLDAIKARERRWPICFSVLLFEGMGRRGTRGRAGDMVEEANEASVRREVGGR